MYKMDMSKEKEVTRKKLLPEGWRKFNILSCEPSVSKSGNDMFIIELEDVETSYIDKIYAISTEGKRWFLKSILAACNVPASQDGVYDWEAKDIIGKQIEGLIEHEDNEWINRQGDKVITKQHRIVEFKASELVEWDKDL